MCITVLVLTINSVLLSLKRWQLISKHKDLGFWPHKLEKNLQLFGYKKKRDSLRSVFYGSLSLIKNFKCWLGDFLSLISPMHFAQSQAGAWYTVYILRTNHQLQLCVGTHTGHTHTPLVSQLLPGGRQAFLGCCHPSSRGPASSAHPAQGGRTPWYLARDSSWAAVTGLGLHLLDVLRPLVKSQSPEPSPSPRDLPAVLRLHCVPDAGYTLEHYSRVKWPSPHTL